LLSKWSKTLIISKFSGVGLAPPAYRRDEGREADGEKRGKGHEGLAPRGKVMHTPLISILLIILLL